jgi:hypothetical protein
MLVTDPKSRASMQEVMAHPWMLKGFGGPPENYLPHREPLTLPLDSDVIAAMTGFNFGPPDAIKAQLTRKIESEEYQRAVRMYQKEKDLPQPPKDLDKKRGFGFDFYKRRSSGNSRDTLTAPSTEGLPIGADPLNAFSPLISIYYLVREKQERDRLELQAMAPAPAPQREKEAVPEITAPKEAHTNASTYEMPGEKATGGRTRPRARTHGESDAPDQAKSSQLSPSTAQPEAADQAPKKESTAAGILRRFSTRRKKEPERLDKDRSHPPVVQVHSPAAETNQLRKSFSIRRSRRDREDTASRLRSGSSQPQHSDLLSPPMSASSHVPGMKKGLGRSTSVNSAEFRRRPDFKDAPPTSGSDQSGPAVDKTADRKTTAVASRPSQMRSKTLGHARRESIQARRARREAASRGERSPVLEETDAELGEHSGMSNDRLEPEDPDLAKPVFLKGLFSVSTTSTKPVPEIRADIKRVLRQLGVDYTEIRGGFSCRHAPSIDLNTVADRPTSPSGGHLAPQTPGTSHRRRFSFGGLRGGKSKDDLRDAVNSDRPPPTPRTPGKSTKDRDDRSYSDSEVSEDSGHRDTNGASGSSKQRVTPAGETSTQVQSDLGGSLVLEFEIFVVKVPVISLHGIQFKRLSGNTWQYKNMADQILKELRL